LTVRTLHPTTLLLLLLPFASGCSDDDERPDTDSGTVLFTWTIDQGATTEAQCAALGAVRFRALLLNRGALVDSFEGPCRDSELDAGNFAASPEYTARVSLLGEGNAPLRELDSRRFDVRIGETTFVRANFGDEDAVDVEEPPAP
jgi:hypothetical protein